MDITSKKHQKCVKLINHFSEEMSRNEIEHSLVTNNLNNPNTSTVYSMHNQYWYIINEIIKTL